MLKESSKWRLILPYFFAVFQKSVNLLCQESIVPRVTVQSYFKRSLIPKELQILGTVFISAYLSSTVKNFNTVMHPGLKKLVKYKILQPLKTR